MLAPAWIDQLLLPLGAPPGTSESLWRKGRNRSQTTPLILVEGARTIDSAFAPALTAAILHRYVCVRGRSKGTTACSDG